MRFFFILMIIDKYTRSAENFSEAKHIPKIDQSKHSLNPLMISEKLSLFLSLSFFFSLALIFMILFCFSSSPFYRHYQELNVITLIDNILMATS